jgi:hypothetical protein
MPLLYLAKYSPVIQIGNDEHFLVQSVIAMIASILLGSLSYSRIENRYRDKSSRGYGGTSGFIKFFVSAFIVPLTIFVIFLGYSEKSNKSMYKDRLDNGECKFWMPNLDDKFYSRFQSCYSKLGPAVVVLGDSHAMNIYNSLFLVTRSKFFVGISAGGCRPVSPANSCFYEDFEELIKSTPQTIKEVIFHQSGSHLISDEQGKLDSESAFRTPDSYIIVNKEIQQLISFLSKIGKQVPLIWIGPFGELRVERTWIHAKANLIEPNPIVRKAFLDLEKQINVNLKKEAITLRYVSSIVTLGNNQFNYKVGSCTLFRDVDHWSTCAEELFSIPLERAYRKSWEHSISTNDTYTFRNQSPIIRGEIK